MLGGKQMGKNTEAMLIIRGLREMIILGNKMGSDSRSFYGTPGLGDLIATASSTESRNYNCGLQISQGKSLEEIMAAKGDVIEGIRSLRIAAHIVKSLRLSAPIIALIHKVIFEGKDIETSVFDLMRYPMTADIDYLK